MSEFQAKFYDPEFQTTYDERLIGTSYCLNLTQWSHPTLRKNIQSGLFPKPDIIGVKGSKHQWLLSTVTDALIALKNSATTPNSSPNNLQK